VSKTGFEEEAMLFYIDIANPKKYIYRSNNKEKRNLKKQTFQMIKKNFWCVPFGYLYFLYFYLMT